MPIMTERMNTQEMTATLTAVRAATTSATTCVNDALTKVNECRAIETYIKSKEEMLTSYQRMIEAVNGLGLLFQNAHAAILGAAKKTFQTFPLPDFPIVREGMQKLPDTAVIANTNLHQYRYLNPADLIKELERADSVSIDDIDINKAIKMDPVDLYALTILMRTYVFVLDAEEMHPNYFFKVFSFFDNIQEPLKTSVQGMMERLEQCRSSKMTEMVNKVADQPANETFFVKFMDHMAEGCELGNRIVNAAIICANFYESLIPVLADTDECIQMAYQMYVDAQAVTF